MTTLLLVVFWGWTFGGGASGPAAPPSARTFQIDDAWGRDTVEFRTTAPLEDIVGVTNQVTGDLTADPRNLLGPGTTAHIRVKLASLKTGIAARDGHVAKALGADENPFAVFALEKIRSASARARSSRTSVSTSWRTERSS